MLNQLNTPNFAVYHTDSMFNEENKSEIIPVVSQPRFADDHEFAQRLIHGEEHAWEYLLATTILGTILTVMSPVLFLPLTLPFDPAF